MHEGQQQRDGGEPSVHFVLTRIFRDVLVEKVVCSAFRFITRNVVLRRVGVGREALPYLNVTPG